MISDLVTCPCCAGDGKETCHNPDHGFISALSFHDIGRLGCPVCGSHPQHKVRKGGSCEVCDGTGCIEESKARAFCVDMDYDYEDIATKLPVLGQSGAADSVGGGS